MITMGAVDPWFDSLYEKHSKKLFKVANKILKNRSVAEELVQDTFAVLLLNREKVKTYDHPEAFLLNVMRKRIGSEIQRECYKREEPLGEKHMHIAAADLEIDQIEDLIPKWVSQQDRQILIWRIRDGLSFQEIAVRMNKSEHACYARMYRLRGKFKNAAKKDGDIL